MSFTLRPAVPADAAVLIEFNQRLAQESEGKTLDVATLQAGIATALADVDKARYFVVEENGVVLGQLMLTREWSDWRNGWIWWIQSVYVRAEARRRGVFRALYEHVHGQALADPEVIGLRLYVERDNQAAQRTYQSLGMDATGYLVFERYPL